jgi:hypothetical protein
MRWPVSVKVERARFVDAFRAVHPDPVARPGNTWSTVFPAPAEPQDRVDFVHARGVGAVPVTAETFVVGTPAPYPDHEDNAWPSDHAAVVAEFDVTPTASIAGREPQLKLDSTIYGPTDPVVVTVALGPGNPTDWIGLYHAGEGPHEHAPAIWRFLDGTQTIPRRGTTAASVTFPAGALAPGDYVANFLFANGRGPLAGPVSFSVTP